MIDPFSLDEIKGKVINVSVKLRNLKTNQVSIHKSTDKIKSVKEMLDLKGFWPEPTGLHDVQCLQTIEQNRNMMIPWYLMTCFAYYYRDVTLISDELFDQLCFWLEQEFLKLNHVHKFLIPYPGVKSGAHSISEDKYTTMIIGAAKNLCYC